MASLHVAFCDVGTVRRGGLLHVADGDSAVSSTLTTSASNTQSAATTKSHVRVVGDAAHWIAFGANPDATVTTGRYYLPSGVVEYFELDATQKVAAVTA
jgi:hypothetical protein